jgi:cytochrome c-type biogenesis protein CcmH/NrfG
LRDKEGVPKEEINPLIEQAYKAVLADAAGCYMTKEAAYKLAGMMLDKGDKANAIKYYQKFLDSAKPEDNRFAPVKAKLAELTTKGGNN